MLNFMFSSVGGFILSGLFLLLVTWFLFINVMSAKNHKEKIPKIVYYGILYPMFYTGVALDFVFNVVYGTVIFQELPKDWLFTGRLRRVLIVEKEDSWKYKTAMFFCKRMLEPWDPDHCGLSKLFPK